MPNRETSCYVMSSVSWPSLLTCRRCASRELPVPLFPTNSFKHLTTLAVFHLLGSLLPPKIATARAFWLLGDLYMHALRGREWLVLSWGSAGQAGRKLFGCQCLAAIARGPITPNGGFLNKFGDSLVTSLILLLNPDTRKQVSQTVQL